MSQTCGHPYIMNEKYKLLLEVSEWYFNRFYIYTQILINIIVKLCIFWICLYWHGLRLIINVGFLFTSLERLMLCISASYQYRNWWCSWGLNIRKTIRSKCIMLSLTCWCLSEQHVLAIREGFTKAKPLKSLQITFKHLTTDPIYIILMNILKITNT